MTCNVCGKELKPGAVFCSACGNKVEQSLQQTSDKTSKQPSRLVWLIIVLGLMFIADFIFYYAVSVS